MKNNEEHIREAIGEFAQKENIELNPKSSAMTRAILWSIAAREYGDARMLPETERDKNAWTSALHNVIEHYAVEIDAGRATTEDFRIHVRAGIGIENKEKI